MSETRGVTNPRPLPAGLRLAELPGLLAALPSLSAAEAGELAHDLDEARVEMGRSLRRRGSAS